MAFVAERGFYVNALQIAHRTGFGAFHVIPAQAALGKPGRLAAGKQQKNGRVVIFQRNLKFAFQFAVRMTGPEFVSQGGNGCSVLFQRFTNHFLLLAFPATSFREWRPVHAAAAAIR